MKPHTHLMASIGLLLAAAPAAFAGPELNPAGDVATYTTSQNIGSVVNGKYQPQGIPPKWKKIIINDKVTLTGRFKFSRDTDLTIEGKSSSNSIIKAWNRSQDPISAEKAGIYQTGGTGKLTIKSLKVQDQPGRGIMGKGGQLKVGSCNIVQTNDDPLSDGIHASGGIGQITFSSIDVYDDATYATMCNYIENVKFTHRKNGAPLQISWGMIKAGGMETTITNCTFNATYNGTYNCGTIDWKSTNVDKDSIKLKMSGTSWKKTSTASAPPKFSFGGGSPEKKKHTVNAKIQVKGWTWTKAETRWWPEMKIPGTDTTVPASTGSVVSY